MAREKKRKGKIIQRETKRNERIKMVNLKASERRAEKNGSLGKCQKSNKKNENENENKKNIKFTEEKLQKILHLSFSLSVF
jgi:hypothetical protein